MGRSWSDAIRRAAERIRDCRPGTLFDTVVATASTLLDAPVGVAVLEDGQLIRRGVPAVQRALLGSPVAMVGTLCGQAIGTGRPVRCDDVLRDPGAGPDASCCPDARSAIVVPMIGQGRVLGVVVATGDRPAWFGDADEQVLVALAAEAGTVLAEQPAYLGHRERPERPDDAVAVTGRVPIQSGPQRAAAGPSAQPAPPATAPAASPVPPPLPAQAATPVPVPAAAVVPAPAPAVDVVPQPGLRSLGLWQWDAAAQRLTCSPQVFLTLGLPSGEHVALDVVRELVHPEDLVRFDEALRHHVARREPVEGRFRIVTPDGAVRHLHAWSDVRLAAGGRVVGAFGGIADVTVHEIRTAALRRGRTGLRAARELTGMGFWEWAPGSGEVTWSPEMFRLAGLVPGAVEPTLARWHNLVHPDDLDLARGLDVESLDRRRPRTETFRVVGADGRLRHVRAWSLPVVRDGEVEAVQGAAVDVTREVDDRTRLERLSATDPVTGLGNRAAFERRIAQMLADPSRDVSLLLLDLDRFKLVNDSLGHQVGDRLLVEVARRLAGVVPGGSLTARMGGDEFVVVPRPGVGWLQVRRLAKAIVETLRQPYVLSDTGEMLVCPVSVGVTSTSGREVGAEDLLSEADLALYRAKDSGRDRYVVFDDALRARARERHLSEQLLRTALERDWLTLRYQRIADMRTGRAVGAEALVRISDREGGLVLPDRFIEVAEDTGLVVELDCWVIDTALDQLARWAAERDDGELPWLAINVSARSMEHPRVVERLLDGLRRRRLPPRSVKVELTEHSFLGTLPGGDAALRRLMSSGIPVGIDDFGTGYSALAYLQRFDLDFMKIDRSFVASVGEQERADAVVTAIVDLAHAHGMPVTAEGIENPRQARRLAEIGCDFAQGFHLGHPVEAALLLD